MKKILAALLMTSATLACAQTADELLNDGKNSENLLSFGGNPKLQMYSPLKQINTSNVKRLVPVWATSTMSETGELDRQSAFAPGLEARREFGDRALHAVGREDLDRDARSLCH